MTPDEIKARIDELRGNIWEIEGEIIQLKRDYERLVTAELEAIVRPLWRNLCAQKGWSVGEADIEWIDEHGVFSAGGRAMHDSEYDIDKAAVACVEWIRARLKIES